MLYEMYDLNRRLIGPWSDWAHEAATRLTDASVWWPYPLLRREASAELELASRLAHTYKKPSFHINKALTFSGPVVVKEGITVISNFCHLIHFRKLTAGSSLGSLSTGASVNSGPRVLLVAPLSGHHATLLRDTVQTLLIDHDVWITDWQNARDVPLSKGSFSLDDYVEDVERCLRFIGPSGTHVIAVCQPVAPVLAAVSLMASRGEPTPNSMILMGGPIDARCAPTQVDNLATNHPFSWFKDNLIHTVPFGNLGAGRRVYPGFLQHAGFVAMNPQRHRKSYWGFYQALVHGDNQSAEAHRAFYDEYNAVLDMPAEYYLDTIRIVFQEHLLPRGLWDVHGERVVPSNWRDGALLTIEGEADDISGIGQTKAAHDLCSGLPSGMKVHKEIPDVGHYGLFSGHRWRENVYPLIKDFIASHALS